MHDHIAAVMADTGMFLEYIWGLPTRVAFIDASHHYEPTLKELNLILPHMVDGGWLILHDYFSDATPGIAQALHEVVKARGMDKYACYRMDELAILRPTPIETKEEMPIETKPRWVPEMIMKVFYILMFCMLVTLPVRADVIHIPDPNLEQVLREAMELQPGDDITKQRMAELHALNAPNAGIAELTGMEFAVSLRDLRLGRNKMSDLTPLASLTQLERLYLQFGLVSDLRPLRQLAQLADLDLSFCNIVDVSPLSNLTHLLGLNLTANRITDVRPLMNLVNLERLYLADNRIMDIRPLANLVSLERLYIARNHITDVRPLANLTSLETLYIEHNVINDHSPLDGLSLSEFAYDQFCEMPPLPLLPRLNDMTFPAVFMPTWLMSYDSGSQMPFGPADQFFDMIYRNADSRLISTDLEHSISLRDTIIATNPNTIFIAYIPWHKAFFTQLPRESSLWARNTAGELFLQDFETGADLDYTNPHARAHVVKMVSDVDKCGLYDGIVLDAWGYDLLPTNLYSSESQKAARIALVQEIRAVTRPNFLIQVNSNRNRIPDTAPYINGLSMETGIPNWFISGYTERDRTLHETETTLQWAEHNLRTPRINGVVGEAIHHEPSDSPENRRWMRFLTTLSLTLSEGYTLYQAAPNTWYDFWDADLGRPVGDKAQLYDEEIPGLYIREYTNGWAVYNHSGEAQVITLSEEVQGVASGHLGTEHALPNIDGEMYLRAKPKNPADVNGDGLVNILDLTIVARGFGTDSLEGDVNGDGVVNILDLVFVANQF